MSKEIKGGSLYRELLQFELLRAEAELAKSELAKSEALAAEMLHPGDAEAPEGRHWRLMQGELQAMREELDERLLRLTELHIALEQALSLLPPNQRQVMRLRYLERRKWEDIAIACNYSPRHIMRLHRMALRKLEAAGAAEGRIQG